MTERDLFDDDRKLLEQRLADAENLQEGDRDEVIADLRAALLAMPPSRRKAPMIIDTDIGDDPDDAIALAVAARKVPELALVITSDERADGVRARFARRLLDSLGRADVPVVRGRIRRADARSCVDALVTGSAAEFDTDVLGAVRTVRASTESQIRWVGMGPASNLANVLAGLPELNDRLLVTQMGGAIDYRRPERAEHNIRLDVEAARTVLALSKKLELIVSDVTFKQEINIGPDSPVLAWLEASPEEEWKRLLAGHLRAWFAATNLEPPGTMQHDALTLSVALELPFVRFASTAIAMDDIGRMRTDDAGWPLSIARSADYVAFNAWLENALGMAGSRAAFTH